MSGVNGAQGPLAIVLIGVSGSGKSTVGRRLAPALGATFLEGDGYHPSANVAKMRAGRPLDDKDRWPWLHKLGQAIAAHGRQGRPLVIACSALRRAYREALSKAARRPLVFVHLTIDPAALDSRMRARRQHFMPVSLLESQLAALEPLADGENGIEIRETGTIQHTVDAIRRWVHLGTRRKTPHGREKGRHRRPFVEKPKPKPIRPAWS